MRRVTALMLTLAFALAAPAAARAATRLLETGSSLLYPLMNFWVEAYQRSDRDVQITTQSTGSGTGISQAVAGVAQIGASDAYLPNGIMRAMPMLNIPLAISAQQIDYNLPGLNASHLRLSGPILAGIYAGSILYWDDARIKAINAPVAKRLPHRAIVPIHRADGSGDTFVFTQYLAKSTPAWANTTSFGTTVSWPALASAVGANGNPGMVQTCKNTRDSIAYIGMSYLTETRRAGLGYAALKNRAGAFLLPTTATIAAAAAVAAKHMPADQRISLVYASGSQSYPLVNFEYAVVDPNQPDAPTAAALKHFLLWAVSPNGGQQARFLAPLYMLPLPPAVAKVSQRHIWGIR